MRVLLFLTGFGQVKEYDYFRRFLGRLAGLRDLCDVFIHCNNPDISADIVTHFKAFPQKNKRLHITTTNAGFTMGAVEAVSNGIETGLFRDYDYVIHLHPDVFITNDAGIVNLLRSNLENHDVFFVNRSLPDDARFFSFDFFVFKPRLLLRNIFRDELHTYHGWPEHYLHDMLIKHDVRFQIVKRFDDDNWMPRRVDDHLGLYHEHDLDRVEALLQTLEAGDTPRAPTGTTASGATTSRAPSTRPHVPLGAAAAQWQALTTESPPSSSSPSPPSPGPPGQGPGPSDRR